MRKVGCKMVSNNYLQKRIYSSTHLTSNRFWVFNLCIRYLKFFMQLCWNTKMKIRFYRVHPIIMLKSEFMPAQIDSKNDYCRHNWLTQLWLVGWVASTRKQNSSDCAFSKKPTQKDYWFRYIEWVSWFFTFLFWQL